MVHFPIVDYQEPVVPVPVGSHVDGRVLVIMLVKVKLKLRCNLLCIDSGRHTRIAFAQHKQYRFIDIVVYQKKGFSCRSDKIRCKLVGIEYLSVIKAALYLRQGGTHEEIYFLVDCI